MYTVCNKLKFKWYSNWTLKIHYKEWVQIEVEYNKNTNIHYSLPNCIKLFSAQKAEFMIMCTHHQLSLTGSKFFYSQRVKFPFENNMKLVAKWIGLVSNNLEFSYVIIIMSSPPPPQSHAKIKFKPRQFFIFLSRVPKKNTSLLSPIVAMHATINLILILKVNKIFSCEHTETCIFYHIIPMQACILRKAKN